MKPMILVSVSICLLAVASCGSDATVSPTGTAGSTGTAGTTGGGGTTGSGGTDGNLLSVAGTWDGALVAFPCGTSGTGYDCANVGCWPTWSRRPRPGRSVERRGRSTT